MTWYQWLGLHSLEGTRAWVVILLIAIILGLFIMMEWLKRRN